MNDELRSKIAALLRKARDHGASEAEALAAAERAARLMAEAGVSEVDVEFEEEQAALRTRTTNVRDRLWGVVAVGTNCAAIACRDGLPVILFIGRAPGPQIAAYLVEVLNRAIDREIEGFKGTADYKRRRTLSTKRAACQDFLNGMVQRLVQRLRDIFQPCADEAALEIARSVRDRRFPNSVSQPIKPHVTRFGSAASAGYAAGGRVKISQGVNGVAQMAQIGVRK